MALLPSIGKKKVVLDDRMGEEAAVELDDQSPKIRGGAPSKKKWCQSGITRPEKNRVAK